MRGVAYQAHRSDTRARTGDEDSFVEETRGVEEGHGADERAGSILSRQRARHHCQPGQQPIAESPVTMMQSHDDHGEEGDEGDLQVRRWSRLLSWLESHGMDLSPSAFHVERRPRAGIFHPFVSPTPKIDLRTSLNIVDAGYGLFLTSPCPVSWITLRDPVPFILRKIATGLPLRHPTISVGEREDACTPSSWRQTFKCPPTHLPASLSAQASGDEGVNR